METFENHPQRDLILRAARELREQFHQPLLPNEPVRISIGNILNNVDEETLHEVFTALAKEHYILGYDHEKGYVEVNGHTCGNMQLLETHAARKTPIPSDPTFFSKVKR